MTTAAPAYDLAARLGLGLAGTLPARPPERSSGREQLLPVLPALAGLLPAGGLRRGSVLQVERSAALTLALLGAASAGGAWCALVGMPTAGVLAATEVGIDTDRLVLVPEPGPDWPVVVAALVDAIDIVVLAPPTTLAPARNRRLAARVRDRSAVLLVHGRWEGAEIALRTSQSRWYGIGSGHGRLTGYELDVESRGRGAASRPRHALLQFGSDHRPAPQLPQSAGSQAA
jgi:hypothetical protein